MNVLEKLCYHDSRNPMFIPEESGEERNREEACWCDNCFYGRDPMALEILSLTAEVERLKAKLKAERDELMRSNLPAIDQMVDRFLVWKLPNDFSPDGGVSFNRTYLNHLQQPTEYAPTGTNLLTAIQAKAMLEYVAAPLLAEVERLTEAATCACGDVFNTGFRGVCPNCLATEDSGLHSRLAALEDGIRAYQSEQENPIKDVAMIRVTRQRLFALLSPQKEAK